MPYGDLEKQRVQRFASDRRPQEAQVHDRGDRGVRAAHRQRHDHLRRRRLRRHPRAGAGGGRRHPVGRRQQRHAVLQARPRTSSWPTRCASGNELTYYPGETNLRMADVVIINKVDTGRHREHQQAARTTSAASTRTRRHHRGRVADHGRPPGTHHRQARARGRGRPDADARRDEVRRGRGGGRQVRRGRDSSIRGRTPWARSRETFKKYPDIGVLLPAMGYGDEQVKDLETTINKTPCDMVIIGTPIDLNRARQDQEADRARELRAAGDRPAGSDGRAEAVPEEGEEEVARRQKPEDRSRRRTGTIRRLVGKQFR